MRRFVVFGVFLFVAAAVMQPAVAQPVWEIGVLGSFNSATLSGDTDVFSGTAAGLGDVDSDLDGSKVGGIAGAFAMVNFTPNIGVRIEGLGTMTGGKGDVSGTVLGIDFTGEMSLYLNYIEIPVLFVGAWPASDFVTLRGYAGPALDFLSNAKLKIDVTAGGESGEEEDDVGELFKDVDFSGVFGAEAAFTLGAVNILLDARFTKGFSNVLDTPSGIDVELKRATWSFMAGLGFPIKAGASSGTGG